jgi:hypothetical protein
MGVPSDAVKDCHFWTDRAGTKILEILFVDPGTGIPEILRYMAPPVDVQYIDVVIQETAPSNDIRK